MFFWNSLAFLMIQQMLAIWSLVPLPFLKPAWTAGSSWFTYCWSLRVFSIESVLCIRWPKYWSFSFSISPSNDYSQLISFRIDCFDLLAVQGTLKSLLQHHNSKVSILQCLAFFMVQLSHLYKTTGKTIALTVLTLVGKAISLLFNMLSSFAIAFLHLS